MNDTIEGEMFPNPFATQAAAAALTCEDFVLVTLEDDNSYKVLMSNQALALGLLKVGEWTLQDRFFKNNLGGDE
ncbi:MAG: hypothetical protein JNL32_07625 [Candidatus Kapabacteria bacterium]|nr:hypothetical protein [Candidatus Kapabacteria bacterium]